MQIKVELDGEMDPLIMMRHVLNVMIRDILLYMDEECLDERAIDTEFVYRLE